jgi:hypothetical protein
LPGDESVHVSTQHRQVTNRRLYPTSFWLELLAGDHVDPSSPDYNVVTEVIPAGVDEEGREFKGATFTGPPRARLFMAGGMPVDDLNEALDGFLVGVDCRSSMYQILSVMLNMPTLEARLRTGRENIVNVVAPLALLHPKQVTIEVGYGEMPGQLTRRHGLAPKQIRQLITLIGEDVFRFHVYAAGIASTVPEERGFEFTDPFDGSPVQWRPIRVREKYVKSGLQIYYRETTGKLDRLKLARDLKVMPIHAADSWFSNLVIEGLHRRITEYTREHSYPGAEVHAHIVNMFDGWLIPHYYVRQIPNLFQDVIEEAGRLWLPLLGNLFDAFLAYELPSEAELRRLTKAWNLPRVAVRMPTRAWMESLRENWADRVAKKQWPVFGTKLTATITYKENP